MKPIGSFVRLTAIFSAFALSACTSDSAPSAAGLGKDCVGEAGVPWDGTTAKTFACGSGTALGPYVILTAEQLARLSLPSILVTRTYRANTSSWAPTSC